MNTYLDNTIITSRLANFAFRAVYPDLQRLGYEPAEEVRSALVASSQWTDDTDRTLAEHQPTRSVLRRFAERAEALLETIDGYDEDMDDWYAESTQEVLVARCIDALSCLVSSLQSEASADEADGVVGLLMASVGVYETLGAALQDPCAIVRFDYIYRSGETSFVRAAAAATR